MIGEKDHHLIKGH